MGPMDPIASAYADQVEMDFQAFKSLALEG
jgi:hypothetical protein